MKLSVDSSIKSVKRALDLLELLARSQEPPSFLYLMRELGVPRSSLFHLMGQLISRGYVEEIAGNRYRLGAMAGVIAAMAARRGWLNDLVRPVLQELSSRTSEFSTFYVVEGAMVRGLMVQEGHHALSYRLAPDHLAPLYAFSAGKVALAELNPQALDAYLASEPRAAFSPNTITTAQALRREVERIRQTGVGKSRSEYAAGVNGFAMAVRSHGDLVGILNVSVPQARHDEDLEGRITGALRHAVQRLETALAVT